MVEDGFVISYELDQHEFYLVESDPSQLLCLFIGFYMEEILVAGLFSEPLIQVDLMELHSLVDSSFGFYGQNFVGPNELCSNWIFNTLLVKVLECFSGFLLNGKVITIRVGLSILLFDFFHGLLNLFQS